MMGKGNVCVFGKYEGLFYVDWSNFPCEFEDEEGNKYIDYDLQRMCWEDALEQFKDDFMERFSSFTPCNKWLNKEEFAILENGLFYVTIEDNEWSIAIKLIQKEDYHYEGNLENLQKRFYETYLKGIKECLFNQFEELGVYTGAWTSGKIYRKDHIKTA